MDKNQMHKNSQPLGLGAAVLLIVGFVAVSPVTLADWHGGLTLGAGYSDNIRRVPTNQERETIRSAGANFDVLHDAPHLFVDATGDLAYLDYAHSTFDKEVVGSANALLNLRIVPQRFEWLSQDNFGQMRSDPFAPLTPANREDVNYFSTGPKLTLPLGSTTRAEVAANYSTVNYQRSAADNQHYSASTALVEQLSQASHLSFNVSGERVAYKDALNTAGDHDVRSAYLSYAIDGARTKALVDVGYNQLLYRVSEQKSSGTLLRAEFTRKFSASSTGHIRFGREFTDASNAFRDGQQSSQGVGASNVVQSANPFVNMYAALGWDFSRNRTGFGLNAGYTKEEYEVQPTQDRSRVQGDLYISRQITQASHIRLAANYLREENVSTQIGFKELGESLEYAWQPGRLTTLTLQLQHFNRNSDVAASEFAESRVWLLVTYGQTAASLKRQR